MTYQVVLLDARGFIIKHQTFDEAQLLADYIYNNIVWPEVKKIEIRKSDK